VQAPNPASSSSHSKVAVSEAENAKVPAVWPVVPLGPESIVVSGGSVSGGGGGGGGGGGEPIVHERRAGVGSRFPAESVDRTSKACPPAVSPV
jgi:hypothetical protein